MALRRRSKFTLHLSLFRLCWTSLHLKVSVKAIQTGFFSFNSSTSKGPWKEEETREAWSTSETARKGRISRLSRCGKERRKRGEGGGGGRDGKII